MAMLFMDSFRWLDVATTGATLEAFLQEKYQAADIQSGTDGEVVTVPGSKRGLRLGGSTGSYLQMPTNGTPTTVIVGFRFYYASHAFSEGNDFIRFLNDSGTEQLSLNCGDNMSWVVRRGGTTLLTQNWINGRLLEWHHLEIKAVIANGASGSIEVRCNGEVIINLSGVDTSNSGSANCGFVRILQPDIESSGGFTLRDVYLMDNSGATNNDFIGPKKHVELILPNADGDNSDWTRSAGAQDFALIDEVNHDSDTTYLESSTSTDTTLVNYDNADSESNILAVQVNSTVKLDAAGSEDMQNVVKENVTEGNSATITVDSTAYSNKYSIFETNPDTGIAWTASEIDGIQAGVEYV